ncbi:MAG: tetratricopeptide repeat protein, partial [Candidatus Obscuribacterales bacterium]|nr:tetratricopeptide repeat protein [Candidatus Obscuribacterales bacterium]
MKNRINTNWAKPVQKQAQAISLALMLAIVFTGSAAIADTTTKETEDDLQPSSGAQAEAQELVPPPDTTKEIVPEAKPAEPAELEDKGKASKQKPKKEKKSKSKSKKKSSEGTEKDTSDRADSAEKAVPKAPDNITESQPEAAPEVSGDSEDQSSESSNQDESGTTSSQGESSDSETTSTANDAEPEEKPKKKAKKPEHISQADKLLLSNDLEAAEEAYRALVEDDETGDAYAGLAVSLAKQKWPKKVLEAERIIRKGKQEFPDNPNMMAAAGFVSLEHSKTVSSPANRDLYIEAAEKLSKMAIAENPEIVIAHQTLGLAKLAQDDAEGAVKPFRTAARLAEDPINLTYWAEALLKINKKDTKAPQIIDEAIGEDPNYFPARLQKAIILTSQGKHEEAFTELHSIPRDERGSDWQNVQGDIYRKQGDGVSALASWKEANRLNPRNPEPYQRLGEYYTLRGDGELAIGEWHNALDILPNDMKLRSQMAELALRLDKLEVAEEEYRTILNVKPDDPKALLGLSRVFFRKARREGGQYPPGFEQLMQQLESVLAEQSVTGQVVKGAANLRENIQLSEAEKALTQK